MNWHHFFLDLAIRGLFISSVAAFAVWKLRGRKRTVAAAFALCALLLLPAMLPTTQMLPDWGITLPDAATALASLSKASETWAVPVVIWSVGFLLIAARLLPGWLRLRQWRLLRSRNLL